MWPRNPLVWQATQAEFCEPNYMGGIFKIPQIRAGLPSCTGNLPRTGRELLLYSSEWQMLA